MYIEKEYIEYKVQKNKQSAKEALIERVMKTTIHRFSDRELCIIDNKADKILKDYLLIEKRRSDLDEVYDDVVIHWFCSKIQFKKKQHQLQNYSKAFHLAFKWCRNLFEGWTN